MVGRLSALALIPEFEPPPLLLNEGAGSDLTLPNVTAGAAFPVFD